MCPHTCKVGPQASFIMENIDADIPCIFFKTFRSPLQDILQRELHIFTRTWLIMLITIKPCLPSIHLNSPWYARWAICIVHVWSAIAYGIWVIQSYAETYLLGILYNCPIHLTDTSAMNERFNINIFVNLIMRRYSRRLAMLKIHISLDWLSTLTSMLYIGQETKLLLEVGLRNIEMCKMIFVTGDNAWPLSRPHPPVDCRAQTAFPLLECCLNISYTAHLVDYISVYIQGIIQQYIW